MVTPGSSSWQEADIYSIKPKKNGLHLKFKELKFCSPIILILEKAYNLSDGLRKIYHQNIQKSVAMLKLARWFKEVEESGFKSFQPLIRTIMLNYNGILNYFNARSTNASAESFNAKIKNFRLQLRGGRDKAFFLFRLSKLFA